MPGPPAAEETHRLEELILAVEDLRHRVAALEQWSLGGAACAKPAPQFASHAAELVELPNVSSGLLAALGRLLLGIAGAYLLRAITETGVVSPLTGTLAGLLYAAAWLAYSLRVAAGHRLSVA